MKRDGVCKTYHGNGYLKTYANLWESERHGEYRAYGNEGVLLFASFNYHGVTHGDVWVTNGVRQNEGGRGFMMHDYAVEAFPFLPPKPPKVPYQSDRTRFQTLEIA